MRPTEEQDRLERQMAEQVIAETPLMEGIERITVELADDHDGDPAMWLMFHLHPDFRTDDAWFKHFVEYSSRLSLKVLHSGLTRFPYTTIRARAAA